ncbi:CHAT domain-containing protein [Lentzea californiensis]|uniref:CHAT domain-containing protein n=1 Tax=Lentzea californiensis TaxID=438851 RepID=UPI002164A706|nr:CHAT domain-containing tetratricopeptide repeat protein [Lentzea californiensis]MCR3748189.1 CHAT domain-containing protein [Lentzea californiensis]
MYLRGWNEQAKFRFPAAIKLLKRALAHADRSEPTPERTEVRVRILFTLGLCVGETSGMDAARQVFDAARREITTLPDPKLRDQLNGSVDSNQGLMVMRMGQPDQAIEWFSRYINFAEREMAAAPDSVDAGFAQRLMSSLLNRGFAMAAVRKRTPAVADLERVLALSREHDQPEWKPFAAHALGNVHKQSGELAEALRRYEEAERIFRADDQPALLARLQFDQAEAMLMIGLSDEAGKHLDEALPVMRKEKFGQEIAEVEMFRASAALLDDQLDLARRMAKRSERKLIRRGSTWWMMAGLIELWAHGRHAMRTKRISNALVQKALALSEELAANHLVDESRLALLLATRLEIRRGRLADAEELLKRVPGPRAVTPLDHRMQRRLVLAELALAKGSRRAALTHARQALDELGRVRDQLGGLELVSATAVHGRELSELAIKLALEDADARRLFAWLERTRAQTYRYEPLEATDNNEVAERITEVRNLSWAILRHGLSGQPTAELRGKLVKAQREANRLGWHSQRWGRPRPVAGIGEVVAELGQRAMVSYVVSGGEMAAVVVAGGRVSLVRLGGAAEALESAQKLHFDLNALAPDHLPQPLVQVIGASAHKQADRLDALLIKPLAHLIGGRELVMVPTGELYAVPWGVLPSLHGRPVATAPSATAWLGAAQGGKPKTDRVLVVQGPGLLFGHGEVDKLATYHANATMLSGDTATAAEVMAHLDGADLVHVAAHGEHEIENALFSRLELFDGPLFAHELGRLRNPPAHVVLAACELALNRIRPGDEALGFAGAMLAGGTRTVVAAASKVGDEASAAAMADYHRALVAGAAPAVALAEAMAKDPFRRPFLCLGSG